MDLRFEERPYAGKTFRPRPEILLDQQARIVIVATPWGPRASARKAIERMKDYLMTAREDAEATSPFERLSCLSSQANNLRIAALLANDAIYREDNLQEYKAGVELFAASLDENELVWVQAGNPQILLSRPGQSMLPLGSQMDLASDLSEENSFLAPLPSQLLGLDSSLNLNINSFRARGGDRVILLSHSRLPQVIFKLNHEQIELAPMSRLLAEAHPDVAYWLGILAVEDGRASRETSPDTSNGDSSP